jgi:hypothetical protein
LQDASLYSFWTELEVPEPSPVVYEDSFTRSGYLNGTAPDVANTGGATWTTAHPYWTTNGSEATAETGPVTANAFLPFVPEEGKVYTLSMDLVSDITWDTNSWAMFGFTNSNATADHSLWNAADASISTYYRNTAQSIKTPPDIQDASEVVFAVGDWTQIGDGLTVPVTYSIVLDTTDPEWTATWEVDGTPMHTETYTEGNPTISYVGFGMKSYRVLSLDNFKLTQTTPQFTPGDFNEDGAVDTADYTIWADNYTGSGGTGGTPSTGDANGDGAVDTADYTIWADNYTGSSGAVGLVPEPAVLNLIPGAILTVGLFRRRRRPSSGNGAFQKRKGG